MSKWAADNEAGQHAYVITNYSWGKSWDRIEYAASLADAKRDHGYTRELYTTVKVRRAKAEDLGEYLVAAQERADGPVAGSAVSNDLDVPFGEDVQP